MSGGRSRVITEPLGGSALSQAIQSGGLPAALRPPRPVSPDEWRTHVAGVQAQFPASWYGTLAPAFSATGEARTRIESVAASGGVVVTTGQQAGLFGGPLYTLAKALTALELADHLQREIGVPAAPVFWAATDDADFLEASVAHVADARGLHELKLAQHAPNGTIMALAPLGDTTPLIEELRAACGSAAHAEYFELAARAFAGEATVGSAYVRMMRSLLEPLGVAVLDSSHDAYRAAARPLLLDALRSAGDIAAADAERAEAIRRAGFEPQVEDDRGLTLVAVIENGVKRRVRVDEASHAAGDAAVLAPNVLLRPIVERAILPTVAYVAGPAELAYFAQSNAVADVLKRSPVVGVPRWSGTVVEPFADRALTRLGVAYHELRDLPALERLLAMAAMPAAVAETWDALQRQIEGAVARLGAAVSETELLPDAVIEGLRRSFRHRMQRTERRLLAAVKRKDERTRHDLRVAHAALFPLGSRQERVLNYVPMLARGGADLVADLRSAARSHAASLLRAERVESAAVR